MKEKRYFCDFWLSKPTPTFKKRETLIIILSIILITFIGSVICYNVVMSNYGDELNSYSVETYEHLDEIANNVIKNGVGIDLSAIPDDVVKYKITSKNDEIIFNYYLDNNKDMVFAPSASMTVKLSNDFIIISKKPNYYSEEEYVKSIRFAFYYSSVSVGVLALIIIMVVFYIGCTIVFFISMSHKNKNLS